MVSCYKLLYRIRLPMALGVSTPRHSSDVDSNHRILTAMDRDRSRTLAVNRDLGSCTPAIGWVAANDVTVFASRETSLESGSHAVRLVVDGKEGTVAARESDKVVSVVVPVLDGVRASGVAEARHVLDLTPAMFADPTVITGPIRVDDRRFDASITMSGWAGVSVVEVKTAHDAENAIVPCHTKGQSLLIWRRVFVGQDITAAPVAALIIVVVDEHESISGVHHPPILTEVLKILGLIVARAYPYDLIAVYELGDISETDVL